MMAAVYGREEIVKILLEAGANKEAKSKNGEMTPLIRACFQGHIAVVKLLIDAKANTEAKAKNGKTALDYAKQQHHDHCVALLQGLTPPPMTEEEARRLAAAEGLQLLPADNVTGFKGVTRNSKVPKSPTFSAKMRLGNKIHNLGCSFRSAAEAALVVARFLGPPPVEPPAAAPPPMMMLLAAAAAHDVPDSSERLLRADSSECLPPDDEPAAVSGVKRSREVSSEY